jgi:hypothetical protein
MKKLLKSKVVRRCGKVAGVLLLAYILAYSALSVFGRYQPMTVDVNGVMGYAWAPVGFYDPGHAWPHSTYAVRHPTEKTGGWHDFMMWAFLPLWTFDNELVHRGPVQ